jgi:fido (protein-threonine AMPylation protein)
MENNHHEKTWEEVQNHGVLSNIQNWEGYINLYTRNQIPLREFLIEAGSLWTKETIQKAHRLLFTNIAPWAGEFSTRQEIIAGIPGSPPELREGEFTLLEKQMGLLEKAANSDLAKIRIAAFHHSRLLCIHPFRDGNGRTSRALLAHQMRQITGGIKPLLCEKSEYIAALQAAHPEGDLAPLSNLLCKTYLGRPDPAKYLPVPFRMNTMQRPEEQNKQLERSLREGPEIINAEETPVRIKWLRRITWFEIEQLVAATPTDCLPKVKELWERKCRGTLTVEELGGLLNTMEEMEPYTQRKGIKKVGTSWEPVFGKLTERFRTIGRKQIENTDPSQKDGPDMTECHTPVSAKPPLSNLV